MALRQLNAYLEDTTVIRVCINKREVSDILSFTLETATTVLPLTLLKTYADDTMIHYVLNSAVPLQFETDYTVYDNDRNATELAYGAIVRSPLFDALYTYEGNDLGATYQTSATHFKFWAPLSKHVLLMLDNQPHTMTRTQNGVWEISITGNLDGKCYFYLHKINGDWIHVHDPYAISSQVNSNQSIVINPNKLLKPVKLAQTIPYEQAVIYEMSVRDFSAQKNANFNDASKFLGLIESPILNEQTIGFDYIKQLGVTHIQLMPIYDFGSVDENNPHLVYNWGYDPVQYNVPEGSYSSEPNDPYARIIELQTVINTYHNAGIGVLMDVVYNHVYNANTYAFERIVPGYFYRYDEHNNRFEGTGCQNDVASERAMVSRYIQHSLLHWVKLYGIDGFRFDLMGIIDIATMNQCVALLKNENEQCYIYGEGWNMPTGLHETVLAHQYNAAKMPDINFFNDDFRDTMKRIICNPSSLSHSQARKKIENLLAGSRNSHFISPTQSLNYIECHDNRTAWDYFRVENPQWTEKQCTHAASFALQLTLISQGVCFIHSGQEFFREKQTIDNSYNVSDAINQLDWLRMLTFKEHVDTIRQLIQFRKLHPCLTQSNYETIGESCQFEWLTDFVLRFTIQSNDKRIIMIINFANTRFMYQKEVHQVIQFNYNSVLNTTNELIDIAHQSICILTEPI